ncbi:hypothetical protein NIE88_18825 [Sporolactobacillus shoreicorticis]|uniref:Uncharacterized protein n=1 Tax=Sporolactobacillus shoreicorticis TaxID=1923877 RepID=A0ABW5S5B3_9BACL|nr:hypothetical protein [Sporolactobacillus shoreicorticis]MCO7127804.1 hypothetical protein [Sporolactobacillus shoreicorticis]
MNEHGDINYSIYDDAEKTFKVLGKTIRTNLESGMTDEVAGLLNEYVNLYDALRGK